MSAHDIYEAVAQLRRDLSKAQQHVTELVNLLNALQLPAPSEHVCEICGVRTRGPLSLAEHAYNSHGGAVPAAWLEAERRAGFDENGQT